MSLKENENYLNNEADKFSYAICRFYTALDKGGYNLKQIKRAIKFKVKEIIN